MFQQKLSTLRLILADTLPKRKSQGVWPDDLFCACPRRLQSSLGCHNSPYGSEDLWVDHPSNRRQSQRQGCALQNVISSSSKHKIARRLARLT